MPDSVLVADDGVAAIRVLRGCRALSIKAVSVHTRADAGALHADVADDTVLIGADFRAYGDVVALVEAAQQSGAQAVHPGGRELPGLKQAVLAAGLGWLGGALQVPVRLQVRPGWVEAVAAAELATFVTIPAPAVDVVSGVDLVNTSLCGVAEGVPRGGVAVSLEVRAETMARVTCWELPVGLLDGTDLWLDAAVRSGSSPVNPLLAVLTAWGRDRDAALAHAARGWDALVLEGPEVRRPAALDTYLSERKKGQP